MNSDPQSPIHADGFCDPIAAKPLSRRAQTGGRREPSVTTRFFPPEAWRPKSWRRKPDAVLSNDGYLLAQVKGSKVAGAHRHSLCTLRVHLVCSRTPRDVRHSTSVQSFCFCRGSIRVDVPDCRWNCELAVDDHQPILDPLVVVGSSPG